VRPALLTRGALVEGVEAASKSSEADLVFLTMRRFVKMMLHDTIDAASSSNNTMMTGQLAPRTRLTIDMSI
jgi:hypothetical protein